MVVLQFTVCMCPNSLICCFSSLFCVIKTSACCFPSFSNLRLVSHSPVSRFVMVMNISIPLTLKPCSPDWTNLSKTFFFCGSWVLPANKSQITFILMLHVERDLYLKSRPQSTKSIQTIHYYQVKWIKHGFIYNNRRTQILQCKKIIFLCSFDSLCCATMWETTILYTNVYSSIWGPMHLLTPLCSAMNWSG